MEDKKSHWWTCPVCGDECSDPLGTKCTQCHNGHSVVLEDDVYEDGHRVATLRSDQNIDSPDSGSEGG